MNSTLRSTARCFRPLVLTFASVLVFATAANADIVTQWTFETSAAGDCRASCSGNWYGQRQWFHASTSRSIAILRETVLSNPSVQQLGPLATTISSRQARLAMKTSRFRGAKPAAARVHAISICFMILVPG